MKSYAILIGAIILIYTSFFSCSESKEARNDILSSLPDKVDYNFHVKPILSDRCFACHGPDKSKQKGGLALHEAALAYQALQDKPGKFAIVPKNLRKSELFYRINSTDPELMMPPPESHLVLSDYEKRLLEKWIKQGAIYQPHWSFIPPQKIAPPGTKDKTWAQNEIDPFILSRLEREGLKPAEKADKEMLIRRLSFDLRGLPPSLEEVDAFLADESSDAYEKWVDQFLASPAYGERMAAHWLDVARFADSDGYLDDKHRDFSPWRDWVIKAFNENLSYRDFITYQLAGDLLPHATKEQILATAFNRLHKRNSEAGIVFEEYRVEYVADRTNTLGKAVLALSFECARCHDHKYDPILQEDYFKMFAFFNSTHEIGHPVYGPDQTPGPALLLTTEAIDAQIAFIKALTAKQEAQLAQQTATAQGHFASWKENGGLSLTSFKQRLAAEQVAHYSFDQLVNVSNERAESPNLRQKGENALLRNPLLQAGKKGKAFFVDDLSSGRLAKGVGLFERTEPFSVDLWLYADTIYEEAGIFLHCENFRLGYKGYSLHLKNNQLSFIMAHSWPQNAIQLTTATPLPVKEWTKVSITYDGSSKAQGVNIYLNGSKTPVKVEEDNLYKGIIYEWDIHTYGFDGFTFGQRDKVKAFKGGGLDEIQIFKAELTPLEVLWLYDQEKAEAIVSSKQQEWLEPYYLSRLSPALQPFRDSLQITRRQANQLYNEIPEIMVMGDLPEPRPTFILTRGNYDAPAKPVSPGVPSTILPFSPDWPSNRLGLTQWLFDPSHPLTARVIVNRIWQLHFGRGIVKTSEDFGNQGDLPSHPELLDWLSVWLQDHDWDLKALHKLIVMSAVYQQNSEITPASQAADPENILLTRGPRFRLPAEMIRDNALAISGLLVEKQGGQSTYPYQPEGLWDELSNKGWRYPYLQEPGEGLYRRSLYTIWKRTAPPPAMLLFDVGNRDVCTVRRIPTDTPLQALVLLNDTQYQEASRELAKRVCLSVEGDEDARLRQIFRLVLGRKPQAAEMNLMKTYYQQELNNLKQHPADASAYLAIGEAPLEPGLAPESLAALSLVANALLNTYEGTIRQ